MLLQVNTHLTPRPILLTRHGESRDNVRGRIGGDPALRSGTVHVCNFSFLTSNMKYSLFLWLDDVN